MQTDREVKTEGSEKKGGKNGGEKNERNSEARGELEIGRDREKVELPAKKKKKKKEERENKQKTKNVETRERERNERQPRDAHFTYLRDFLQALPNRAQKNRGKLVPRSERKKKNNNNRELLQTRSDSKLILQRH